MNINGTELSNTEPFRSNKLEIEHRWHERYGVCLDCRFGQDFHLKLFEQHRIYSWWMAVYVLGHWGGIFITFSFIICFMSTRWLFFTFHFFFSFFIFFFLFFLGVIQCVLHLVLEFGFGIHGVLFCGDSCLSLFMVLVPWEDHLYYHNKLDSMIGVTTKYEGSDKVIC